MYATDVEARCDNQVEIDIDTEFDEDEAFTSISDFVDNIYFILS